MQKALFLKKKLKNMRGRRNIPTVQDSLEFMKSSKMNFIKKGDGSGGGKKFDDFEIGTKSQKKSLQKERANLKTKILHSQKLFDIQQKDNQPIEEQVQFKKSKKLKDRKNKIESIAQ